MFIRYPCNGELLEGSGRKGELAVEQGGPSQLLNSQHTFTLAPQASRDQQDASLSRSAGAQSFLVLVHPHRAAISTCTGSAGLAFQDLPPWGEGRRALAVHATSLTRGRTHARVGEQAPTQTRWPVRLTLTPDLCLRGLSAGARPSPKASMELQWKSSPLLSLG